MTIVGSARIEIDDDNMTREEMEKEANLFRDFLVTKNECLIMALEEQAYNG